MAPAPAHICVLLRQRQRQDGSLASQSASPINVWIGMPKLDGDRDSNDNNNIDKQCLHDRFPIPPSQQKMVTTKFWRWAMVIWAYPWRWSERTGPLRSIWWHPLWFLVVKNSAKPSAQVLRELIEKEASGSRSLWSGCNPATPQQGLVVKWRRGLECHSFPSSSFRIGHLANQKQRRIPRSSTLCVALSLLLVGPQLVAVTAEVQPPRDARQQHSCLFVSESTPNMESPRGSWTTRIAFVSRQADPNVQPTLVVSFPFVAIVVVETRRRRRRQRRATTTTTTTAPNVVAGATALSSTPKIS